jgi:hypothetical protein
MNGCSTKVRGAVQATLLCLCVLFNGCVSKNKAQEQAREAFFAGQQQAAMLARQQGQAQGPTVTIIGEVRNPLVPWTTELTLAKAVVAADYYGQSDPSEIVVQRNGQEMRFDSKKLLTGADVQLMPSDVIELRH